MQYITIWNWLFSLSIIPWSFIQVVGIVSSFLFIAEWYFMVWMGHNLFNHLHIEGNLGWFQFLAVTDKAAVSICVHVFVWMGVSFLWDKFPVGRLLDCMVYMYHFFFIHLSVDGHLGCFHDLAIVKVLQWTLGCMCFLNYGFLRVYAQ